MGYWARAVLSYGFSIPDTYEAEWLEDGDEDDGTAIIRALLPGTEIGVIESDEGGYRVVRYEHRVTQRNSHAQPTLEVTEQDKHDLLRAAGALGISETEVELNWLLTTAYV